MKMETKNGEYTFVIKEECFSDTEGQKDMCCNVNVSVFLQELTLLRVFFLCFVDRAS